MEAETIGKREVGGGTQKTKNQEEESKESKES